MQSLVLLAFGGSLALAANAFAGINSLGHIVADWNEIKDPGTQLSHQYITGSRGKSEACRQISVEATGKSYTSLPLNENDVILLELVPVRAR